jgi:hypothetical protein
MPSPPTTAAWLEDNRPDTIRPVFVREENPFSSETRVTAAMPRPNTPDGTEIVPVLTRSRNCPPSLTPAVYPVIEPSFRTVICAPLAPSHNPKFPPVTLPDSPTNTSLWSPSRRIPASAAATSPNTVAFAARAVLEMPLTPGAATVIAPPVRTVRASPSARLSPSVSMPVIKL